MSEKTTLQHTAPSRAGTPSNTGMKMSKSNSNSVPMRKTPVLTQKTPGGMQKSQRSASTTKKTNLGLGNLFGKPQKRLPPSSPDKDAKARTNSITDIKKQVASLPTNTKARPEAAAFSAAKPSVKPATKSSAVSATRKSRPIPNAIPGMQQTPSASGQKRNASASSAARSAQASKGRHIKKSAARKVTGFFSGISTNVGNSIRTLANKNRRVNHAGRRNVDTIITDGNPDWDINPHSKRAKARKARPKSIKELFQDTSFTTGLWLLICFPIGLLIMWSSHCKWNRWVKTAITSVLALAVIAIFVPLTTPPTIPKGGVSYVDAVPTPSIQGPVPPEVTEDQNYNKKYASFAIPYAAPTSLLAVSTPTPTPTYVYCNIGGKKYHVKGCKYIKNKKTTGKVTLTAALNAGLTPCGRCGAPKE